MIKSNQITNLFRILILLFVCLVAVIFIQTNEAVDTEEVATASTLIPTILVNTPQATIDATSTQESNYTILCTATPYVSPDASQAYTESATIECTEYSTPTEAPTATPEPYPHSNGEWFIVYATSYSQTDGRPKNGCKNDIPLVDEWSCASFLDEYLPYGTIIEIENMGLRIIDDTCNKGGIVWNQRVYDITKGKFQRAETWIDIYFADTTKAEEFGRMLVKIRIVKYGDGNTYTNKC